MSQRPIVRPIKLKNPKRVKPKRADGVELNRPTYDALSQTLYELEIASLIEDVGAIPVEDTKILTALEEAMNVSDREAAIIIFALIDYILVFYFKMYLRQDMKNGLDPLFDGFGYLATANARLTMAVSIHWLQNFTFEGLSRLRKIRNYFAHHADARSLSGDPIRGWVRAIASREEIYFDDLDMRSVRLSDRDLFLVRSFALISALIFDLTMGKHAIERGIHPSELGGRSPENVTCAIGIGHRLCRDLVRDRYGVVVPDEESDLVTPRPWLPYRPRSRSSRTHPRPRSR